jgi:hypothetical protein
MSKLEALEEAIKKLKEIRDSSDYSMIEIFNSTINRWEKRLEENKIIEQPANNEE